MVISILYPNFILLLVYYADICFSWFPLPELLIAFREPNLKRLHMLRTVFGAADTHLRGKGKITSTFNRFYDWSYETEHPQQTIVFTKSQPRERTLLCHDSIWWGTGLRKSLTKMISRFHVIHEQILTFKVYSILFLVIITKPKLQLELQSLIKASLCLHLNTGVKVPVSAFLCRGSYERLDKFTVRGTYFFFFWSFYTCMPVCRVRNRQFRCSFMEKAQKSADGEREK